MEIVKICKKHGPLTADQVKIGERKDRKPGAIYMRCRLCHRATAGLAKKEKRRLYREGLTDLKYSSDIKAAEDRKLNPDKYKKWTENSRKKLGPIRNAMEISRRAGITLDQYQKMIKEQNYLCKICNQPETRTIKGKTVNLSLALCHVTGKAKGFLCSECNLGLGLFNYDPKTIHSAMEYLRRFQNGQ